LPNSCRPRKVNVQLVIVLRKAGDAAVDSGGFGLGALPSQNPPTPMRDVPPVRFRDPYSLSFNGQDQWMTVGNPPLLNAGGLITPVAR